MNSLQKLKPSNSELEATTKVKRVIFTGDFLRPNAAGQRPTQHHNIRWLTNLVSKQIELSTGLPQSVFSWGADGISDGQLTSSDVEAIYRNFGLSVDINNWASIHGLTILPSRFEALLNFIFRDSLVVGFELPPYLESYFSRCNIPYISAAIHPVRFLDDIFLAWKSNIRTIQERIFDYKIDENFILTMAGIQRASAARCIGETLKPNSALFVMQTWYDQSQIKDGSFISAENFIEEIKLIAQNHSELLVKEHPLLPSPATILLQASIPNLRMVSGNIYGYLSTPEVSLLVTISSSVGIEAPYFGVPTHFLLPSSAFLCNSSDKSKETYVGIVDAFLTPDFWRSILCSITHVTACDGILIPFKANRLRISLRSFWNFNQIDTDIASALLR